MARLNLKRFRKDICKHCNFRKDICKHCNYCDKSNISFCYSLYQKNSQIFGSTICENLERKPVWPTNFVEEQSLFISIFCSSGVCGEKNINGCGTINFCISRFINQNKVVNVVDYKQNIRARKKENKKEYKKINKEEVSFIYGGCAKWLELVAKKSMD